jgi:hypothetical protein
MYFQTGQVFYMGNILVNKNILCNGCFLNKIFGSIQSLHVIWTVSHFMPCVGQKFLEDVHEDSMQFPSQNSRFLCNRPDGPLKAFGCPAVSRSLSIAAVWTTELQRPDARSSYSEFDTELDFRRQYLGRFCQMFERCGNTSGCYPAFQNILGFLYGRGNE